MMRISTTVLEAWRLFNLADQEWMTLKDLEQSILGSPTQNRPMLIGLAFEKLLAEPPETQFPFAPYPCDGYAFEGEGMEAARRVLPLGGVWQVKIVGQIAGQDIVAKADYLCGADIYSVKTTGSTFDVQRYQDSYQWRIESLLFGAPSHYRVWPYSLNEKTLTVTVKPCEALACYPYVGMAEDCARLVRSFAEFVQSKGWDAELNRRQRVAV